jgi:hypothetical protein
VTCPGRFEEENGHGSRPARYTSPVAVSGTDVFVLGRSFKNKNARRHDRCRARAVACSSPSPGHKARAECNGETRKLHAGPVLGRDRRSRSRVISRRIASGRKCLQRWSEARSYIESSTTPFLFLDSSISSLAAWLAGRDYGPRRGDPRSDFEVSVTSLNVDPGRVRRKPAPRLTGLLQSFFFFKFSFFD